MLCVGAAACCGVSRVAFPPWFKTALQIMVGAFVGCNVDRRTSARIRALAGPLAFATAWMTSSALLIGFLFARYTGVGLVTALLGTRPAALLR